jgi:polysaccharide pyruvyl transferase WcaK-like protein
MNTANEINGGKNDLKEKKVYNILLLTNRDSDNVGDQVIEATDIALISAVMKNLNIEKDCYKINSRACSIVSQKYIATKKPELLDTARTQIQQSDIIIFGGAPVFNYLYQTFYERTAVTLELAEEYHKPVIFSAVGIERYDEKNKKCQRLKKTLNFDCVKQITTRDGYEQLKQYKENEQLTIGKVSDPAVFSAPVFKKSITAKKAEEKKKVGVFILRANGFVDNKINFSRDDSAAFWVDLVSELEKNGYEYELLTSGHFGDEAFLDYLIRNYGIQEKKCVFNMNTPEKLISKISSYDGVISCRLHPSIISFSLGVPSLGIIWNSKVTGFYNSIGYGDRTVSVEGITSQAVVQKMGQIISEGIEKDEDYLISVYTYLFNSIRKIVYSEENEIMPYTYQELLEEIPAYQGTSNSARDEKIKRKFRRTYNTYNTRFDKAIETQRTIDDLKNQNRQLKDELEQLKAELKEQRNAPQSKLERCASAVYRRLKH